MKENRVAVGWLYPVGIWLLLLSIVFASEYAVMLILPRMLGQHSSRTLEAIVDAVVLTLIMAPLLWGTIVRPLTEIIRLRTRFLADLFEQIERDRRQTAHDLHDGVGQSLTLLISGLRSAKGCRKNAECSGRVNEFQRLAEEALADVRRLSLGLRPSLLDDLGLAPALERLVEDVRGHHPVEVSLDVAAIVGRRLPDRVATTIFRIVQEALSNIMKHAQAKKVTIQVRCKQEHVILEVSDDGRGIEPAIVRSPPAGHLGLRGMRERANLVGGAFLLESAPGQGTRIMVSIPAKGAHGGQNASDARGRS
jgi:signal transduction histidine kinase